MFYTCSFFFFFVPFPSHSKTCDVRPNVGNRKCIPSCIRIGDNAFKMTWRWYYRDKTFRLCIWHPLSSFNCLAWYIIFSVLVTRQFDIDSGRKISTFVHWNIENWVSIFKAQRHSFPRRKKKKKKKKRLSPFACPDRKRRTFPITTYLKII